MRQGEKLRELPKSDGGKLKCLLYMWNFVEGRKFKIASTYLEPGRIQDSGKQYGILIY